MTKRLHLQYDWLPVVCEVVEIRRNEQTIRRGLVDGVTPDGGILWIAGEGAEPRAMFERAQGFTVWIEYKWESLPSTAE